MRRMDGRAALVTGGTTGLGFAVAERFIAEGGSVAITGRDTALGSKAERELGGRARFVRADAADAGQVSGSVEEAVAFLGGLDVLVNNAGIGVQATLLDTPVEDFDAVMAVNVRGYFLYAKACLTHLAERRGSMIHISSDAGVVGEPGIGAYSVSKAAVIMLSNMLAIDAGAYGVRSNCIAPGDILPGMRHMGPPGSDAPEDDDPSTWPVPPIGRIGEARDVAASTLFLASEDAEFCTGVTLLVDGGMRAGYRWPETSASGS
jgi:NAD(P)-dependent dehydrogenase (short-subunit alcohol dehydrogenase family)